MPLRHKYTHIPIKKQKIPYSFYNQGSLLPRYVLGKWWTSVLDDLLHFSLEELL